MAKRFLHISFDFADADPQVEKLQPVYCLIKDGLQLLNLRMARAKSKEICKNRLAIESCPGRQVVSCYQVVAIPIGRRRNLMAEIASPECASNQKVQKQRHFPRRPIRNCHHLIAGNYLMARTLIDG